MISRRRGRKYDISTMMERIPVILKTFDVLYIDGEDVSLRSYPERRKIVEKFSSKIISPSVISIIDNSEHGNLFFGKAIEDGMEGIIAKSVEENSIYRAGAREWLWIKLKKDYSRGLTDTFDLVIVGAYYGSGRRGSKIGGLLMAAYNAERGIFETVCRMGSGITDEIMEEITEYENTKKMENKPNNVSSKINADIWLEPEKVLEIAAAEITLSPTHTCGSDYFGGEKGFALRFPRFTGRIRDDKSPQDCTTSLEIHNIYYSN